MSKQPKLEDILMSLKKSATVFDMNELHPALEALIKSREVRARETALMKWDLTNLTGVYDSALIYAFQNGGYTIQLPDCKIEIDEKKKIINIKKLRNK